MNDNRFDQFGGNQPFNEQQNFSGNQSFNNVPPFSGFQSTAYDPNYGKGDATASLVLGIAAVVCCFFGYSAILSVICGIIGLVCASKSKSKGYNSSVRTAGYVLSLIGLIGGAISVVITFIVFGVIGTAGLGVLKNILSYV